MEQEDDDPSLEEDPMAKVNSLPAEYPRVTAYLSIDGASEAIEFYCDILGAIERVRMAGQDGRIGHAELAIGDSMIMLSDAVSDAVPDMSAPTPRALGGSPVTLMVYVEDVDDVFARAIKAGATQLDPLTDKFYGDRSGQFEDRFGHRWNVASHVEDVPPDEMEKRAAAMMSGS